MEEINSMVGEEIKKNGSRGREEEENRRNQQGKEGPMARKWKGVPCRCENLSASLFSHKVAGSGPVGLPGLPLLGPTPTVPVLPDFHLLGASSLQDPQVVVLFGHSKFEATHRVVEAKGGILSGQRAGKYSHYGVQGREVRVAAILCSPTVVPPSCTRQPLSILKPLDLGARHGKLGEEFVCLRPGDSFREVRHLQHSSQHNICCAQVGGGGLERLPLASVSVLQSALSLVHGVS